MAILSGRRWVFLWKMQLGVLPTDVFSGSLMGPLRMVNSNLAWREFDGLCSPRWFLGEDDKSDEGGTNSDDIHIVEGDFPVDASQFSLLELPLTAMGGIDGPKTMKFRGRIADMDVVIMVDSGASHNFMSHHLIDRIPHPLEPTTKFGVRLRDGRRTESDGKFSNLPVDLGPYMMLVTFHRVNFRSWGIFCSNTNSFSGNPTTCLLFNRMTIRLSYTLDPLR
nr:peroxidase 64 [Ipomoea batatas]